MLEEKHSLKLDQNGEQHSHSCNLESYSCDLNDNLHECMNVESLKKIFLNEIYEWLLKFLINIEIFGIQPNAAAKEGGTQATSSKDFITCEVLTEFEFAFINSRQRTNVLLWTPAANRKTFRTNEWWSDMKDLPFALYSRFSEIKLPRDSAGKGAGESDFLSDYIRSSLLDFPWSHSPLDDNVLVYVSSNLTQIPEDIVLLFAERKISILQFQIEKSATTFVPWWLPQSPSLLEEGPPGWMSSY
jgi:hypothetical protein